jgi:hypothetical protein
MKIEKNKYVIATKDFPLQFEDNFTDGEDTEFIEDAAFYDFKETAVEELDRFDEPEKRQILKVKITYEF